MNSRQSAESDEPKNFTKKFQKSAKNWENTLKATQIFKWEYCTFNIDSGILPIKF